MVLLGCYIINSWNPIVVGSGHTKANSIYFESWKIDFSQYRDIVEIINGYKWCTKFDSFICCIKYEIVKMENLFYGIQTEIPIPTDDLNI